MYHHDQMRATAVPQRAARVLVPQPQNCRLSDAVSTHVAPRNSGASVSGPAGAHEASGTFSSSFALRHRAWVLGNAVSQRAARMLVPQPQNCRLSDAYRWAAGAENPAHLFRGQLGCLQRMGH